MKINSEVYINSILRDCLLPWAENRYGAEGWVFTQDRAPSHTSHLMQNFLCQHNPSFLLKEFWPPPSPDINPLDFCLWSVLEERGCKISHRNLDELKSALEAAWDELPQEVVHAAVEAVPKKIVSAKGSYFEK